MPRTRMWTPLRRPCTKTAMPWSEVDCQCPLSRNAPWRLPFASSRTRIGENDPKTRNRGPYRHYIDLPAVLPFARVVSAPLVAAIVHRLLGPHAAADRLASDTPLGVGSVYQAVHLDVAQVCVCARACVALSISRSFHTN